VLRKNLLYTKANNKPGDFIMEKFVSVMSENLIVSLKLSWNNHWLIIRPFLSESSHSKKSSISELFAQLLLLAVRYSLCL